MLIIFRQEPGCLEVPLLFSTPKSTEVITQTGRNIRVGLMWNFKWVEMKSTSLKTLRITLSQAKYLTKTAFPRSQIYNSTLGNKYRGNACIQSSFSVIVITIFYFSYELLRTLTPAITSLNNSLNYIILSQEIGNKWTIISHLINSVFLFYRVVSSVYKNRHKYSSQHKSQQ